MRHRLLGASLLLVAAGLAVPAAASGGTACTSAAALNAQRALNGVADAASALPGYTGVELTGTCGPINVYAATPQTVAAAAQGAALGVPLRFVKVAHSMAYLTSVHARTMRVDDQLLAQGIVVRNFWPDIRSGRERVGVPASMGQLTRSAVQLAVGGDVVVETTTLEVPQLLADRANDASPWNAGEFIETDNADCTAGAGVHELSGSLRSPDIMTAGHCVYSGTGAAARPTTGKTFYNQYADGSGTRIGSKKVVGPANYNLFGAGYDIALITIYAPSNSSRQFWGGGTPTGTKYNQNAAKASQAGNSVCTSGAFEGARCGTVQSTNLRGCSNVIITDKSPATRECGQVLVTSTGIMGGHGDSGGPVYINVAASGGYPMTGIISAGSGAAVNCTNYTYRNKTGTTATPACFKGIIFTDLPTALSQAGVSLNTAANP